MGAISYSIHYNLMTYNGDHLLRFVKNLFFEWFMGALSFIKKSNTFSAKHNN